MSLFCVSTVLSDRYFCKQSLQWGRFSGAIMDCKHHEVPQRNISTVLWSRDLKCLTVKCAVASSVTFEKVRLKFIFKSRLLLEFNFCLIFLVWSF